MVVVTVSTVCGPLNGASCLLTNSSLVRWTDWGRACTCKVTKRKRTEKRGTFRRKVSNIGLNEKEWTIATFAVPSRKMKNNKEGGTYAR